MNDRISVIMPCYNAETYLKESIDNVLSQTYPNVELIVVDDGSTDKSRQIIEEYGAKIVSVFQENKGCGPSRNVGLKKATGDFIAFLDADDYWEPHCLQALHDALVNTKAVLSYAGWQNIGGKIQRKPYIPPDYELNDKAEQFLKSASPWPVHAALVRSDILKQVGGFDEQWSTCEDYDLWLKMAIKWPIVRVEQVLAYYRHHESGQMTSTQWRQAKYVMLVKENFIKNNPELVKHISRDRLSELINDAFLQRGYDAYWKRDLISAHKIFRLCLKRRCFKFKDLKYLLLAVLPEQLFFKLVKIMDGSSK